MKIVINLLLFLASLYASAQETFPVNGPHHSKTQFDVFVNATIQVDEQTKLTNATLIIKNGKIEQVGIKLLPPAGAMVHDMKGRYIYPAFVELCAGTVTVPKNQNTNKANLPFISSKSGAYHWNEAIKPEVHAVNYFTTDEKQSMHYRACGFGSVLAHIDDGIYRGTAVLATTGNAANEHELIIKEKAASVLSFKKGNSPQDYPSSLMGCVALLRQTYYDARWYANQNLEKNLSLLAFNEQQTLPQIFIANHKLNVLRAAKIADEFNLTYIIKGAGDEYQRISEIKATKAPLIVPVNFPKPFEVSDPYDADLISLGDLKHWEMAPYNLEALYASQIECAITSDGCKDASTFLKNLKKAHQNGASSQQLLRSLTTIPARLINMEQQLGAIKPGMMANLIVTNGDLFDEETNILAIWTKGVKHTVDQLPENKLSGNYQIQLSNNEALQLIAKSKQGKQVYQILNQNDTLQAQVNISQLITIGFPVSKSNSFNQQLTAYVTKIDSSSFPYIIKEMQGEVALQSGIRMVCNIKWVAPPAVEKPSAAEKKIPEPGKVLYPFTEYGYEALRIPETVVFKNAVVWTNEQEGILKETDVAIKDGKICAIGKNISIPAAKIIDATGKHLTAGIIDEHSHIAITQGVNEGTQAITSEVRIGDAVNSEDINIYRQLAGGVVAAQLLHGSANPIGGQSALIKLRWGLPPEQMKIEGADGFIKFALGENVKQSNWGDRATIRYPQTRMGVEQIMIDGFTRASQYELDLKRNPNIRKDLELEALLEILRKKRFISCHSYVQSEINMLMHLADSFGFKLNTFTHILEGYKVADKMKKHGVYASTFADWWAYKYEVIDAIPYNAAILNKVGVLTAVNSDDAEMGRRLNQEAAKIVKYGGISEEEAWKMVTLNPARMLHLDNRMGSVKVGKDADIVLWNNHPLSIYAQPEYTYVDGKCLYSKVEDVLLRTYIQKERMRIIAAMQAAKAAGEKTENHVSETDPNYHCED